MRQTLAPTLGIILLLFTLGCSDLLTYADAEPVDTDTRSFTDSFPADSPVRLANLAGSVEIVAGGGSEVVVETTVHAAGRDGAQTERLLSSLQWEESRDVMGKPGWALSYPVQDYDEYHYPGDGEDRGWSWGGRTATKFQGEKVYIHGRKKNRPTLYADLKITVPGGSTFALRNVMGEIRGGDLSAHLDLDTGSGSVRLGSVDGDLTIDTGSGAVEVGDVRGDVSIDTGSGHVSLAGLTGNGTIDTGSGHIEIGRVDADRLDLDTGSGSIRVADGRADSVLADTGSGSIGLSGVDVVSLDADTGSGSITLTGSLARAERIDADTGSGDVTIRGDADASFDLSASLGSGRVEVGYADAELKRSGRKVVGARRGDGRTRITVDTGSGSCTISPS